MSKEMSTETTSDSTPPVRVPAWAKAAAKEYVAKLWSYSVRSFRARQWRELAHCIANHHRNAAKNKSRKTLAKSKGGG